MNNRLMTYKDLIDQCDRNTIDEITYIQEFTYRTRMKNKLWRTRKMFVCNKSLNSTRHKMNEKINEGVSRNIIIKNNKRWRTRQC